jgi:hypothetical protein
MSSVVLDLAGFRARYPEFSAVADATLNAYFSEATLYLSNNDNSPVQDLARRSLLLNMITAHIAQLATNGGGSVGRVSSGTEGSVSASTEYLTPGTHSWFTQTQYGASFWQATTSLRGFRYRSRQLIW